MKKIIIISTVLLLAILLSSCGTPNEPTDASNDSQSEQTSEETTHMPKVTSLNSYTALVYEMSVGAGMDYNESKMYRGDKFNYGVISQKKNVISKNIKISEKEFTAHYRSTKDYIDRQYNIDRYSFTGKDGHIISISYRTDTNKVVSYNQLEAKNSNYISAVNPASTEAEYIAYAKKIILDNTGMSLDGWMVKIESYSGTYGRENKFVNYEEASLLNTYTFTFYKTIDGIERCDKTVITMTNMGEIISFEAMPNDEAFAPYLDLEIDADKVKEAVWDLFGYKSNLKNKQITSGQLVTNDDGLWVEVSVEYTFDSGAMGGMSFVVQVAEIEKTPTSADKTQ